MSRAPLLSVQRLVKHYPHQPGLLRRTEGWVRAVDDVSFDLLPSDTVGLVGESGCGKSTLAKLLVGLLAPTNGAILFNGHPLSSFSREHWQAFRRSVQVIFQSPMLSFNPRMTIGESLAEPLVVQRVATGAALRQRVSGLLSEVGLEPSLATRFPSELSGGQRQRAAIARALALKPALIICDEPVASLDLSVQRQVLELLDRLQRDHGITYLFISHHLGVVSTLAHRVLVMYLGRIVEQAENPAIFQNPRHPYTQALVASVSGWTLPLARPSILGEPASALAVPAGCRFHPRCPIAESRCRTDDPTLAPRAGGRVSACHLA